MQDLNDLYFFVHVVDHAGFAPAGRALGVPKSKLSRRLANLEERLGVQLIKRSTRHFSVTEIGQDYYRHCKAMLVEADAAQEAIEITRAEPCGVVRMTCPIGLLGMSVDTMLAKFMVEYPRVDLHLEATDRQVDLVGESVDLAIRVRPLPLEDSELVMRVLGNRRQCLVASPPLLARFAAPEVPADLARLPSLGSGQPHHEFAWELQGPDTTRVRVKHQPRLVTGNMVALRRAAIAGVGIVKLPYLMVSDEIRSGQLVAVLPGWVPQPETIHIVFVSRRYLLPAVRSLIDFLAREFAAINDD